MSTPIEFKRASRKQSKIRLLISGPAGSGKTYSALQVAFGLGDRVAVIDTERGSAELYSDLGEYYVVSLNPPFLTENYLEAIHAAEGAGFDIIIIDSLTHAWAGDGGILDLHDKATGAGGNSYTAWKNVTPLHRDLIDAMLQSPSHVIATVRSKTSYVIDQSEGKCKPVKVGLAPVQRDGIEYEFTIGLDMALNHTAGVSKDRTGLFRSEYFTPCRETGERIKAWLATGAELLPQPPRAATTTAAAPTATVRSPPKVLPNGTPTTPAAAPTEDPAQHTGHLNDMEHCFDCGIRIDSSREGMVSKRDHGRYLCLAHLKLANQQAEANAKPVAKPAAPKAAPPAAPKAVAEPALVTMDAPEEKRDQPSSSPLAAEIARINAEQEAIDKQPAKKSLPGIKADPHAGIVSACQICKKGITEAERSMSRTSLEKSLCRDCLDKEFASKPAVA